MNTITEKTKAHAEIRKTRDYLIKTINEMFDDLIIKLENPQLEERISDTELKVSLSTHPAVFVGKKPIALIFNDDERVAVKSWREVYRETITRCYESTEHHEMLMYLRDKAIGKVRKFISAKPDGMTRPLKIADELYGEVQYSTECLLHILVNQILTPARFDCYSIKVILKEALKQE